MKPSYRPLDQGDILDIHRAALDLLSRVGIASPPPLLTEIALGRGCATSAEGRLCFPQSLIEDIIAGAARSFVAYAPNPANDLEIGGGRVHFATAGEAVMVYDLDTDCHRPATIADLYDFARLADCLKNVDYFGQTVIATDIEDRLIHDINIAYACYAGTQKSFGISVDHPQHIAAVIEFFDFCLGNEGAFLKRPFCTFGGCPIVSPLRFAQDSTLVLMENARRGLTCDVAIAAQANATGPASLAGTLVQTTAETLAALAVVNLVRPGNPMLFGIWPFVCDVRTGVFSGGGAEQGLLAAAAAQICRYYDVPGSVGGGMTDSKLPDAQAAYEKSLIVALTAMAGADVVNEAAGMLASLMTCSAEAMIMDDDLLGMVNRTLRGIEVDDRSLSTQEIANVAQGIGHYLANPATLQRMESEYEYPSVANRLTLSAWQAEGRPDMRSSAKLKAREILANYYPNYINGSLDSKIRARYDIRLSASRAGAPKPAGTRSD